MGVVYEAEQAKPSRRVAVKVIRDSERGDADNLRLFQREIHILGRLHHPAIAQIYDAGQADDGQQYYVMELVDGRPLVEYCDLSDLPLARAPEAVRPGLRCRAVCTSTRCDPS